MRLVVTALACAALAACGANPPPPSCASAETLAAYPNGQFLENLIVERSGRVLFTSYIGRTIEAYTPGAEASTFVSLDTHPVGIAPYASGYLVSAHGAPFTAGPAFTQTNVILLLDAQGRETARVPAPEALFLNGIGALPDGAFLIADSLAARLWRFDPVTRALSVWLEGPELGPDPTGQDPRPGANGVEVVDGAVLVSNSSRGALLRVPIGADFAPAGPVETIATPGVIDDFAVAPDGAIYLATHTVTLLRIAPETRAVTTVLPEGADGSTAVALTPGGDALYALTTGGLFEGGRAEAKLLRVSLPGGDAMCAAE